MLNSKVDTSFKLSDILLAATLSFKLPPDASTAIRSVAFLLRAHADQSFSSTVVDLLIDKVIDKIDGPLSKLNDTISATNNFLDATSQKQAAELLSLQESVKQQGELVKLIADVSKKSSLAANPRNLAEAAWPPLPASGGAPLHRGAPAFSAPRNIPHADPKVMQCVALTAKQLLIKYSPLEDGETLHPKTLEEQRELHQLFNDWINATTAAGADVDQRPPAPLRAVCSVSIFDRPSLLLEFDSAESKDKFSEMIASNSFLLSELGPKAQICPGTYAVIFRFVPCNGPFNPSLDENLHNLERENDLPANSILAASWCKRPDRRNQQPRSKWHALTQMLLTASSQSVFR